MRNPIHPGETLRDDLDALGMSAAELAHRIQVPVNRITEILNGRRAVTGDTALRLARKSSPAAPIAAQPTLLGGLHRSTAQTPRALLRHLGRILA